jgi:hypothetical protein
MEKEAKNRQRVIWLAGITLFTVFIWVALDSYHELVRRDRLEDVSQLLTPIDPDLDEKIIEEIEQRREYKLEEVEEYLKSKPTAIPTIDDEETEEEIEEEEVVPEEEVETEAEDLEKSDLEETDLKNLETGEIENSNE